MSQRTALVVDDSRSARFALRKYLEGQSFKVDTADSARAAYQWLASSRPDLIFLDHVMPDEDGFAALRHLKADPQTAAIPVVICSSNEGPGFVAEARSQGAVDVLQKPPKPEQLGRVLAQLEASLAAEPSTDNEPISLAEEESGGIGRYIEPDTPPAPSAVGNAPKVMEALRAEAARLREEAGFPAAFDARMSAVEARLSAMEQRVSSELTALRKQHDKQIEALRNQHMKDLAAVRKQLDGDLRAVHQQFAEELARGLQDAREQAVEAVRATLLRALQSG